MDRTGIAGLLFALVGASWLVRFSLDPALTAYALVSALIGVGFLSAGIMMFRRERQNHTSTRLP